MNPQRCCTWGGRVKVDFFRCTFFQSFRLPNQVRRFEISSIFFCNFHVGVSKNRGTPKIIHFNRVFHYKPWILGYPYFWKHPCGLPKPTAFMASSQSCLPELQAALAFPEDSKLQSNACEAAVEPAQKWPCLPFFW